MSPTICVPLDGSAIAEEAIPFARTLAQRSAADLVLLRVVDVETIANPGFSTVTQAKETAQTYMMNVRYNLINTSSLTSLTGSQVRCRVTVGPFLAAFTSALTFEKPSMIVMTTQSRATLPHMALGSAATTIIQHVGVPVILLHPDREAGSRQTAPSYGEHDQPILVTLDGRRQAEAILEPAIALARILRKPLTLLRITQPVEANLLYAQERRTVADMDDPQKMAVQTEAETYLEGVCAHIRTQGIACSGSVRSAANVATQIVRYAQEIDAVLIAMATHARDRVAQIALGSVADAVLRQSALPLLTVYATAEPHPRSPVKGTAEKHFEKEYHAIESTG